MFVRSANRFGSGLVLAGAMALAFTVSTVDVSTQTTGSGPLTLNDVVQVALKNHPAIKEGRARAQAANEGVSVARTAYLPRLDLLWQQNRATRNNVFGLLLPQSIVPPISGPVLGTRSSESVWSSATGVLLSWEFVDFGQRKAGVDVARAQESLVQARAELTELDTTAAAADAFLTVLAADEAARAAQANVDRLQVFADAVRTLVRNELRPGADESRADAELAVAKNALSQAIQVSDIARASLAENIGAAGMGVEPLPGRVAQLPEILSEGVADVKTHPAARAGSAAIEATRARERQLARSLFPRLTVQSAIAARGSGSPLEGQVVSGDGLWPKVQNWATGITVTVPLLETFSVASRKRVEIQNELAETARYDQTIQGLTTQEMRARALLKAATDIARNTPFQLKAAADAERRARAIPEWTGDHHRGCGGAAVAGAGRSGQCAGPARHVASHVGGRPGPRRSDAVPGEDPTLNHRYECLGEDECG